MYGSGRYTILDKKIFKKVTLRRFSLRIITNNNKKIINKVIQKVAIKIEPEE